MESHGPRVMEPQPAMIPLRKARGKECRKRSYARTDTSERLWEEPRAARLCDAQRGASWRKRPPSNANQLQVKIASRGKPGNQEGNGARRFVRVPWRPALPARRCALPQLQRPTGGKGGGGGEKEESQITTRSFRNAYLRILLQVLRP